MSAVLFFIAAIAAIIGAIGVVTLRNPLYAVLSLVCHLVALAALFLLLRAEFVAAAQVVVYAGAVMVLYVFVVAYVGGGDEIAAGSSLRILGPLFAVALAVELFIAMLGTGLEGIKGNGAPYKLGFGTPAHIGKLFLTDYLFAFEVASLLLLVAAIGAIVLARRRRGLDQDEADFREVRAAPRPAYTGTLAEAVGIRRVLEELEQAHGGVTELIGGVPQDKPMTATVVGTRDIKESDDSEVVGSRFESPHSDGPSSGGPSSGGEGSGSGAGNGGES